MIGVKVSCYCAGKMEARSIMREDEEAGSGDCK